MKVGVAVGVDVSMGAAGVAATITPLFALRRPLPFCIMIGRKRMEFSGSPLPGTRVTVGVAVGVAVGGLLGSIVVGVAVGVFIGVGVCEALLTATVAKEREGSACAKTSDADKSKPAASKIVKVA